jgi:elongation factor Tu
VSQDLQPSLPFFTVGVIGHLSHGKTTLSAAIPRVLSNAPPKEAPFFFEIGARKQHIFFRRRAPDETAIEHRMRYPALSGRTSRAEAFELSTDRWRAAVFDLPGHHSRFKNVATTLPLLDIVVLVVSALDSIQPQTREHLLLAKIAGVSRFVVFLNFCEQVDDVDWIDAVEAEVRELFSSLDLPGDDVVVIRGAALPAYEGDPRWEPPVLSLVERLESLGTSLARASEKDFLFMVERAYSIPGKGTVATGRVLQGQLTKGQPISLSGFTPTRATTVTEIRSFRHKKDMATAGDYVGLLLRGLMRHEVRRGQMITQTLAVTPRKLVCTLTLVPTSWGGRHSPLNNKHLGQFYFGTADVSGIITLPEGSPAIIPGERDRAGVEVELLYPSPITFRMPFALRDGSDGLQHVAQQLDPYGELRPKQWGGLIGYGTF